MYKHKDKIIDLTYLGTGIEYDVERNIVRRGKLRFNLDPTNKPTLKQWPTLWRIFGVVLGDYSSYTLDEYLEYAYLTLLRRTPNKITLWPGMELDSTDGMFWKARKLRIIKNCYVSGWTVHVAEQRFEEFDNLDVVRVWISENRARLVEILRQDFERSLEYLKEGK